MPGNRCASEVCRQIVMKEGAAYEEGGGGYSGDKRWN